MEMYLDLVIFYIIVGLFGLVIGSFLNVVIYRYANGESVVKPASHCPNCKTFLKPTDLVPVFSFLFLRGRCRYCSIKISPRYAAVELISAAVFLISFHYHYLTPLFFKSIVILCLLIVISGIDLDKKIIPNRLVIILAAWSLIWQLFYPSISWADSLLGLLAGGGTFFIIALVSRGGMGFGDVKLMGVLGFLVGWPGVAGVILFAFVLGALVGVIMLAAKRAGRKTSLPFGPFIALGYLLFSLWGMGIWAWYISFFQGIL